MENLLFSLNAVLPLLLLITAGYIIARLNIVSRHFLGEANRFVFRVALPFMLCRNIYQTNFSDAFDPALVGFALASILLITALGALIVPLFAKNRQTIGAIIQAIYRSNYILFGLPLATNLFGTAGAAPTSMLIAFTIPTYTLLAVIILTYYGPDYQRQSGNLMLAVKPILGDIIKNPLIVGSIIGLIINILPFTVPQFLDKTVSDIGSIATPLALIIMGSQFDFSQLQGRLKTANIVALSKLVLTPIIMVSLAILLGFRGPKLGALYILFAAPTSVTSYIMARDMKSDHILSGQLVILTTLLCGFTLFIGIYLLRTLGMF